MAFSLPVSLCKNPSPFKNKDKVASSTNKLKENFKTRSHLSLAVTRKLVTDQTSPLQTDNRIKYPGLLCSGKIPPKSPQVTSIIACLLSSNMGSPPTQVYQAQPRVPQATGLPKTFKYFFQCLHGVRLFYNLLVLLFPFLWYQLRTHSFPLIFLF